MAIEDTGDSTKRGYPYKEQIDGAGPLSKTQGPSGAVRDTVPDTRTVAASQDVDLSELKDFSTPAPWKENEGQGEGATRNEQPETHSMAAEGVDIPTGLRQDFTTTAAPWKEGQDL